MKKFWLLSLILFSTSFIEAQTDINYKMVVAQDGSGDFTRIQDAIDAAKAFPTKPITIT